MNVVVLGASPKPDRYSYKAVRELVKAGHRVFPVGRLRCEIEGLTVGVSLVDIVEKIDTVTVYVSPENIQSMIDDIIKLRPNRVILNPGAESDDFEQRLIAAGIPVINACTLVMLRTQQF
jgi:predicted CoA-binding protein